jgi:hypothetical protein
MGPVFLVSRSYSVLTIGQRSIRHRWEAISLSDGYQVDRSRFITFVDPELQPFVSIDLRRP